MSPSGCELRERLRERLRGKPAWLRELREFLPRAHVREMQMSLSRKPINLPLPRNSRNCAGLRAIHAQPLAQLAQPVITPPHQKNDGGGWLALGRC